MSRSGSPASSRMPPLEDGALEPISWQVVLLFVVVNSIIAMLFIAGSITYGDRFSMARWVVLGVAAVISLPLSLRRMPRAFMKRGLPFLSTCTLFVVVTALGGAGSSKPDEA